MPGSQHREVLSHGRSRFDECMWSHGRRRNYAGTRRLLHARLREACGLWTGGRVLGLLPAGLGGPAISASAAAGESGRNTRRIPIAPGTSVSDASMSVPDAGTRVCFRLEALEGLKRNFRAQPGLRPERRQTYAAAVARDCSGRPARERLRAPSAMRCDESMGVDDSNPATPSPT